MRMNVSQLPMYAAAVAAGILIPATALSAPPSKVITGVCSDVATGTLPSCTCGSPSGFFIQLSVENPLIDNSNNVIGTIYQYQVSGSGNAKVSGLRELQVVVPRPVQNVNADPTRQGVIQQLDVTRIRTYCEPDPNSGNNKGNCGAFLVHANVSGATNTAGTTRIPVGSGVADGMVTFNVIGGQGNTELCSAVNISAQGVVTTILPPSGIAGPGDIGDPFQPKFVDQISKVAGGKCEAHLIFDKKGNVIDVATDPPCFVGSPGINPATNQPFCVVDPSNPTAGCQQTNFPTANGILVNNEPLRNNNGPHGFTFGNGTTTCYGPSIPSPAKCVCTKLPCP